MAAFLTLNMKGSTRTSTLTGTIGFRPPDDVSDHLGSVRAVVDGDTGTVLEANDFYPFGKRIPLPVSGAVPVTEALSVTEPVEVTAPVEATVASTGSATSQNRWLFSGKESQSFLSASIPLLDFGARMYDPITARWTAQDPLAEKYYAVSPYAYCLGNPISHIDDDGQMPQVVAGAIVGAAIEGVIAVVEGKTLREIGGAVVGGAVEGALVSLTGGMSLFGSKVAANVLSAGVASMLGSATSQMIGTESVDAKQMGVDAAAGMCAGASSLVLNKGFQQIGNQMAQKVETTYSSKTMRQSVEKEVKKELRQSGVNLGGKSGKKRVEQEVGDRISNHLEFGLSIANSIKDTKIGDITSELMVNKIKSALYNNEEE